MTKPPVKIMELDCSTERKRQPPMGMKRTTFWIGLRVTVIACLLPPVAYGVNGLWTTLATLNRCCAAIVTSATMAAKGRPTCGWMCGRLLCAAVSRAIRRSYRARATRVR